MPPLPTHVFVTSADGRITPIPPKDALDVGNRRLMLQDDEIRRVTWSVDTRRSWKRGDLHLCNAKGQIVDSPYEAAAPAEPEGGRIQRYGLRGSAPDQVVDANAGSRSSASSSLPKTEG